MKFAERMNRFGEGIFSRLAEIKRQKLEAGENVVDLSIGAPNIPPAQHILDVLCKEAADKNNYIYAINDQKDLLQAVSQWYERRYGVNLDPDTEICSLLGSQEGLAHIAMSSWMRETWFWCRIRVIRYLRMVRVLQAQSFTICRRKKRMVM